MSDQRGGPARPPLLVLLLLALAVGAACAKRPAVAAGAPPPSAEERLRSDLRLLVTDAAVDHASWSVLVRSLAKNDEIYSLNAVKLMIPASNQKLLTSAAAAERLGWDHQYTTRVIATGPIKGGTLEGDLIVIGDGDPSINPRHPDRWGVFDKWAGALANRGVRIVTGQLIGDDNAFAEPGWGEGWAWDDIVFGYGSKVGALQYHENQIELLVGPGVEAGARAIISTTPLGSGMVLDHGVTTAAAGAETKISQRRIPGSNLLSVTGQIALDAQPLKMYAGVENPTLMYVNALREALGRHGIFIAGGVADIDDLRAPPGGAGAEELIVDRSPPLADLVDVTLKWSRNGYAETLLHSLSPPGEPATAAAGLKAMQETLGGWGVPPDSYVPHDGSGLSRYDYLTAASVVATLSHLWADPKHADRFRGTLPVAGVSGNIESRLKGTPAEARVWAKTGSMSNIRSMSGYVMTTGGEPLVFSILVNGFRVPSSQIDGIVDKALLHLVAFERAP